MLTLNYSSQSNSFFEHGVVLSLKDGIAEVAGLNTVTSGELVRDTFGNYGLVLNLQRSIVGVVFLSDRKLRTGALIYRCFKLASIPVSPLLFGSVLDVLGRFLSYNLLISTKHVSSIEVVDFKQLPFKNVETKAPGILIRQSVYEPVSTGLKVIDGLIPLGKGQRELIIGDRQTGKTTLAIDAILNQATKPLIYI
jgi:F0F1-type ATP synthase alpha subunit